MKIFFELIQVALGNLDCLSRPPSIDEWKELYEMAKKQSLVGVCFAGVQKLYNVNLNSDLNAKSSTTSNLSKLQYLTWMGMAAKIQQRNEVVNRQCVDLQECIKKIGYRSCVLKGQSAAKLYQVSKGFRVLDGFKSGAGEAVTIDLTHLRQSGDIDIWVDAPRKEIIEMVQKIAPTTNVREHHLELQFFQDTEVEVHFWPAVIRHFRKNRKLQKWFDGKRDEVFKNHISLSTSSNLSNSSTLSASSICAPTPEFHAIQMMAHMYHHLFDSGIGLRQVMDYYMVLRKVSEFQEVSKVQGEIYEAIKHIGMGRFASAMMYVLQETMGLPREKMICEPNEKDGKFLLGEIMRGGNFGRHDDRKTRNTKSYFSSFFGGVLRNFRYLRFNPFDWFWSPLWRLYYFGWRKINGYH